VSGGGRILLEDDPFADLIPKAKPRESGDIDLRAEADPFQDLIPRGTVTVGQPKGVVGGHGETLITSGSMAQIASGEHGLAPMIGAGLRLGRNRQGYQNIGNVRAGEETDLPVLTARELEAPGARSELSRDVRKRTAPGTASTATNIALTNALTVFSPGATEAATEAALERYTEGGGDASEHASLFGLSAALGEVGLSYPFFKTPSLAAKYVAEQIPPAVREGLVVTLRKIASTSEVSAGGRAKQAADAILEAGKNATPAARRIIKRAVQHGLESGTLLSGERVTGGLLLGEDPKTVALEAGTAFGAGAVIGGGLGALGGFAAERAAYTAGRKTAESLSPEVRAQLEKERLETTLTDEQAAAGHEAQVVPDPRRLTAQAPTAPEDGPFALAQREAGIEAATKHLATTEDPAGAFTADLTPARSEPAVAPRTLASEVKSPFGEVVSVPGKSLHLDPSRFQFKHQGIDSRSGAGAWVKGAKRYNPVLGGVWVTWIDPADGLEYVVNSHHRKAIWDNDITAGRPDNINVLRIHARDAAEARAVGARINIAEGHGTPLDVAQFIRDSGLKAEDLEREGISLRGELARQGSALAELAPDLLAKVGTGELQESHGVAIGEILAGAPELQREVVGEIKRSGRRLSDSDVREVARQVEAAGTADVRQETLFGGEVGKQPLFVERAQLASTILKRLGADRRILGFVAQESRAAVLAKGGNVIDVDRSRELADQSAQLEELFQRLYTRDGAIAKLLTQAAGRVARGSKVRAVADEIYASVADAVQAEITAGTRSGAADRSPEAERSLHPGAAESSEVAGEVVGEAPATEHVELDPNQDDIFGVGERRENRYAEAEAAEEARAERRRVRERANYLEEHGSLKLDPPLVTRRKKTIALETYRETGSVDNAIAAASISRERWAAWRRDDPKFRDETDLARRARAMPDEKDDSPEAERLRTQIEFGLTTTELRKERALEVYADTGVVQMAADGAGVSPALWHKWRKTDPEFLAAVDEIEKTPGFKQKFPHVRASSDQSVEAEEHRERQRSYEARKREREVEATADPYVLLYREAKAAHQKKVSQGLVKESDTDPYKDAARVAVAERFGRLKPQSESWPFHRLDPLPGTSAYREAQRIAREASNPGPLAFWGGIWKGKVIGFRTEPRLVNDVDKFVARVIPEFTKHEGVIPHYVDLVLHEGKLTETELLELGRLAQINDTREVRIRREHESLEQARKIPLVVAETAKKQYAKTKYEFSSTQIELPQKTAAAIKQLAADIPDADLAADGREKDPHVTIKYGIHDEDPAQIRKLLEGERPITVTFGETSFFPNGESNSGDVLKADVDSPDLHRLNKKIAGAVANTDTHPEYKPHATIAYLKPGLGKKYAGDDSLVGRTVTVRSVTFSSKDGTLTEIRLNGVKEDDLFGYEKREASLFADEETGKAAAPRATEGGYAAKAKEAHDEAEFLRRQLVRMGDSPKWIGKTARLRSKIADLERIANFAEKLKTEEIAIRADDTPLEDAGEGDLFRVEEGKKKHYEDPSQQHLFFTYGSIEKAAAAAAKVVEHSGKYVTLSNAIQRGQKLLTSAQRQRNVAIAAADRARAASVSIVGKTVTGPHDIAQLLYPFRSPAMEQFSVILTNDKGVVLSHTLDSSGVINYSMLADRLPRQIAQTAKRLGATRVHLAHNHPSGDPTPSPEDKEATAHLAYQLGRHGLALVDHVVTNHKTFGWMKPGAKMTRTGGMLSVADTMPYDPPALAEESDWTQGHGDKLETPMELAAMTAGSLQGEQFGVVYVSSQGHTLALEPRPKADLETLHVWLKDSLKTHAADRAAIVFDPAVHGEQLSAVVAIGKLHPRLGHQVFDVVSFDGTQSLMLGSPDALPAMRRIAPILPEPAKRLLGEGRKGYGGGKRNAYEQAVFELWQEQGKTARLALLDRWSKLYPEKQWLPGWANLSTDDLPAHVLEQIGMERVRQAQALRDLGVSEERKGYGGKPAGKDGEGKGRSEEPAKADRRQGGTAVPGAEKGPEGVGSRELYSATDRFTAAVVSLKDIRSLRAKRAAEREPIVEASLEEIEKRWQAAKGVSTGTIREKVEQALRDLAKVAHHFPELDPGASTIHALVQDLLLEVEHAPSWAKAVAHDRILGVVQGLTPGEVDLMSRSLVLNDIAKDVENGLYDDAKEFPFGYTTSTLAADTEKVEAAIAQNPKVAEALRRRSEFAQTLTRDLVAEGLLQPEVLRDERYYHRQVMAYLQAKDERALGVGGRDVRVHKKGFQKERVGGSDFNTAYAEAEFEWVSQALQQLHTARALKKVQQMTDIQKRLVSEAKAANAVHYEEKIQVDGVSPETHPLRKYSNKIFWATRRLYGQLEKGLLDEGEAIQFDDLLKAFDEANTQNEADNWGVRNKDKIPLEFDHPDWFPFLSYLADRGGDGAMEALTVFKAIRDRRSEIETTLGREFLTWESLVPDGYATFQPEKGNYFYKALTVEQKALELALDTGDMSGLKAREAFAMGGLKPTWVVPEGIAATLEDFGRDRQMGRIERSWTKIIAGWKWYQLLRPGRAVKYNLNNTSGDMDAAILYPQINLHVPAATQDIYDYMVRKKVSGPKSDEMRELQRLRVIGNTISASEIGEISKLPDFRHLVNSDPLTFMELLVRYAQWANLLTQARENILRLAAYRYFKQEIDAGRGERLFAASNPAVVRAERRSERRAAILSRDLVGDYGAISTIGMFLRERLFPFWSWQEINFKRYVRFARNVLREGGDVGRAGALARLGAAAGARGSIGVAKMGVKAVILANLFMLMAALWNRLMFPEEEKAMRTAGRTTHIILGRDKDGEVITVRIEGAFADFLGWAGLKDYPRDVEDLIRGTATVKEKAIEMAQAPINRIASIWEPVSKTFIEVLTGRSLFPDAFKPRVIRDRADYVARQFALTRLHRLITGKPARPSHPIADLLVYRTEPGEAAYYGTQDLAERWLKKAGHERAGMGEPTERANALYYWKKAAQWGDDEAAARWYRKYRELGGTKKAARTSIRAGDPLRAIPHHLRGKFLRSLDARDRQMVEAARAWFKSDMRAPARRALSRGVTP
jgi:DNA repair protein RadC